MRRRFPGPAGPVRRRVGLQSAFVSTCLHNRSRVRPSPVPGQGRRSSPRTWSAGYYPEQRCWRTTDCSIPDRLPCRTGLRVVRGRQVGAGTGRTLPPAGACSLAGRPRRSPRSYTRDRGCTNPVSHEFHWSVFQSNRHQSPICVSVALCGRGMKQWSDYGLAIERHP